MDAVKKEKNTTSKELPFHYKRVLSLIPEGSDKPITAKQISDLTGLSVREVRAVISKLILKYSIPIGSINTKEKHGNYIITDDEERDKTAKTMRKLAYSLLARAYVIEKIPSTKEKNEGRGN